MVGWKARMDWEVKGVGEWGGEREGGGGGGGERERVFP